MVGLIPDRRRWSRGSLRRHRRLWRCRLHDGSCWRCGLTRIGWSRSAVGSLRRRRGDGRAGVHGGRRGRLDSLSRRRRVGCGWLCHGLRPVPLPADQPIAGQRQRHQSQTGQHHAQASPSRPCAASGTMQRRPTSVPWHHHRPGTRCVVARPRQQGRRGRSLGRYSRPQNRVVAGLLVRIQQTNFRRCHLVQQLLRQIDVLSVLEGPQVSHLPIGRREDHVRIRLEQIHTQQTIVVWRPRRIADT